VETTNENEMKTEKMAPITRTENQMKVKTQINPETDPRQNASGSRNSKIVTERTQTNGGSLLTRLVPINPNEPGATTEGVALASRLRQEVFIQCIRRERVKMRGQGVTTECSKSSEPGFQTVPDVQNTEIATRTEAQQGCATFNVPAMTGAAESGNSHRIGVNAPALIKEVVIPDLDEDPEKMVDDIELSFVVQGLIHSAGMVILQGSDALDNRTQMKNKLSRKEFLELLDKLRTMKPGKRFASGKSKHAVSNGDPLWEILNRMQALSGGFAGLDGTQEEWERLAYGRLENGVTLGNIQNVSIQLAVAVATGNKFLGHETRRGDVVYLSKRTSVKHVRDRVDRLSAAAGCRVPEGLTVLDASSGLRGAACAILEQLEEMKPRMIIFEEDRRLSNVDGSNCLEGFINTDFFMSLLSKITGSTFVFVTDNEEGFETIPRLYSRTTTLRFTDSGVKGRFKLDLGTARGRRWDWKPQLFVNYQDPLMVVDEDATKALRQPVKDTESR